MLKRGENALKKSHISWEQSKRAFMQCKLKTGYVGLLNSNLSTFF